MRIGTYPEFHDRLARHFNDLDTASSLPGRYRASYTGRHFETFADTDHPHEITPSDLVAVSMLSVNIPANVTIWLLGEGRDEMRRLLEPVPTDVDIWDGKAWLATNLNELWNVLDTAWWPAPKHEGANKMGLARKSKLLAVKRPRLVPILDNVVVDALGPVDDYWTAFGSALNDTRLRDRLNTLADEFDIGALRVIDIVVWMTRQD